MYKVGCVFPDLCLGLQVANSNSDSPFTQKSTANSYFCRFHFKTMIDSYRRYEYSIHQKSYRIKQLLFIALNVV